MIHSPPEVTVLGLYTVELSSFIDGDYSTEETCRCVGGSLDVGEEEEEQKKEEGSESKKVRKNITEGYNSIISVIKNLDRSQIVFTLSAKKITGWQCFNIA